MTLRSIAAVAAITVAPVIASAHPGHGPYAPNTWAHYLLSPVHAIPIAIVAWFAVLVVALRRRRVV